VPPPGLFGGKPGTPGSVTLSRDGEHPQELPSKIPYRKARRGDVLRLVGPCGGGYGDPSERDPAAIERDARNGLQG
jgi:N-methylhydantoinase B